VSVMQAKLEVATREKEEAQQSLCKAQEVEVSSLKLVEEAEADLRQVRADLVDCQNERMKVIEERNSLKSKANDLSKELRRIVGV